MSLKYRTERRKLAHEILKFLRQRKIEFVKKNDVELFNSFSYNSFKIDDLLNHFHDDQKDLIVESLSLLNESKHIDYSPLTKTASDSVRLNFAGESALKEGFYLEENKKDWWGTYEPIFKYTIPFIALLLSGLSIWISYSKIEVVNKKCAPSTLTPLRKSSKKLEDTIEAKDSLEKFRRDNLRQRHPTKDSVSTKTLKK